jgi:hypothetical protein
LEARSIFFACLTFDFEAISFQNFYRTFLGSQSRGFDPVSHVRCLALRLPETRTYFGDSDRKRFRLEHNIWRDTLAILRSPRWNPARLFLEDRLLTMTTKGEIFAGDRRCPQSFRYLCQLRGVGKIQVVWQICIIDALYLHVNVGLSRGHEHGNVCARIYNKALNETTSKPRPDSSRGMRHWVNDLTGREIDQIEANFKKRVKQLWVQEGLSSILQLLDVF